jgi:hypothetical protein
MSVTALHRKTLVTAILLLTPCRLVTGATLALDNASDFAYADGWQMGDNGGTGFGSWTFAFSGIGTDLLHPPQFIDNGPLSGHALGAPAFALTTSNRLQFTDTSEVQRTFVAPLGIGQTFSADLDGSSLDPIAIAFTIGNTLDLYGTNGSKRFSLFTNNQYHNDHWTATGDADTGIPAENAFHIDFTLVTADSYNLVMSPIGGGAPYFTQFGAPLAGTSGVAINRLRISDYGTGSSADGSKELFFNNLVVTAPDADFNKDDIVDAADYVVWRKTGLDAAAGNLWRTSFGEIVTGSDLSTGPVPEPVNILCVQALVVFYVTVGGRCMRRRGRSTEC